MSQTNRGPRTPSPRENLVDGDVRSAPPRNCTLQLPANDTLFTPRCTNDVFIVRSYSNVTVNDEPAAKSAGTSRGGAFPLINLIQLVRA